MMASEGGWRQFVCEELEIGAGLWVCIADEEIRQIKVFVDRRGSCCKLLTFNGSVVECKTVCIT